MTGDFFSACKVRCYGGESGRHSDDEVPKGGVNQSVERTTFDRFVDLRISRN